MPRPTELAGKAIGKMKGLRQGLAGHRGIMKRLAEEHGEVCPAGWTKGKTAMKATREGVTGYLSKK